MDKKLFTILKKVYHKKTHVRDDRGYQVPVETGDRYDCEKVLTIYATSNLSAEDQVYLEESGYPVNEVVHSNHDEVLDQLKAIILNHPNLTLDKIVAAYVAGFGSFPRGRQPILSYLFAKAVPDHSFQGEESHAHCQLCGLAKDFWLHKGYEIFHNYWGYSWTELAEDFYLDLAEFASLESVTPTEEDIQIFRGVIDLIGHAPEKETVSGLEKRIKSSKFIPGCEKYRLRGQLLTLAELGVLPNPALPPLYECFTDQATRQKIDQELGGSHRSDIILPLKGWTGQNPLNQERLEEIFGRFL